MKVVAVIPARYASHRLPGKPLADIGGKPMIQWVYELALAASGVDQVIVATDDERIQNAVQGFGGDCRMTDAQLRSGTERVAAIAQKVPADFYVNVQGDEPLLEPQVIEAVVNRLVERRSPMVSAMKPIQSDDDWQDPSVVKVLAGVDHRAVYFSRASLPYGSSKNDGMQHIGIYGYSSEALKSYIELPACQWEQSERLEQLRAIYHGMEIGMVEVESQSIGVDTPEDLEKVRRILV